MSPQERIEELSKPRLADGAATESSLIEIKEEIARTNLLSSSPTGLTNTQLRATPVEVELDTATLAALETTELGAATLAALETTELGATTLAALETTELGATTLAALETIELGATTLAALETISVSNLPVTQPVSNAGTFAVQNTGADVTNGVQPMAQKKIAASTYAPTLFQNLAANVTLNVKASAGNVFSLTCYNGNAAARYIQLHNTATTPAGSAVPVFSFVVPPASQIIIGTDFFTNEGAHFSAGIAFAFSIGLTAYVAGIETDQATWIQYK